MFCKECGTELNDQAKICKNCRAVVQLIAEKVADPMDSNGMRMLLPVGRSGYAIAAGYLGLFSVLGIFAPLAIIFGILAIVDIKKHPEKHGMGRAIFGIIMGVIPFIILVVALVSDLF